MRRGTRARVARWAAFATLTLGVVEACSTDDTTSLGFTGPTNLSITAPADGDSVTLGCDDTLVVQLDLENYKPQPPGLCGTASQCGSVRVSLLETANGQPLISQLAATAGVQLDLSALVNPKTPEAPSLSQVHFLKVDLLDDALGAISTPAPNKASVEISLSIMASDCSATAGAGAGGAASSSAGASGAPSSGAGTSGSGGAAGAPGTPGAGGEPAETGGAPGAAGADSQGLGGVPI
jgi:hypothetical protein